MLIKILIALAAIIVVLLIVVALQPSDFRILRSAVIGAPPAAVFPHVNDLHLWEEWSPWAKLDPNAKSTFDGPPAGIGASMAWAGNNKVGEGRMTITESRPNDLIRFRLDFFKPMKATNDSEFTFKPQGNQTAVTWSMSGKNNFMGKAFGLIVNCDRMIGSKFEKGLAQLNTVATAGVKV
jgi:uncharacterized protein YndB with AHSA1/START domain